MRVENSFILAEGVGERTERRLWDHGVTHWDEFCSVPGIGETTCASVEAFIDRGYDELDAGNARFFAERLPSAERWRLYENFRSDACFFDIETTGLSEHRDVVTTVSVHCGGETTTLVRDDDLTRERVREELAEGSLLVSFNGARFDVPFLETAFDLSIDTPHLDLLYPCRSAGLTGGLKRIEREVGIGREEEGVDGLEAVRLWKRFERHGDEGALDRLVRYNREDTENLATLADHVADELDRDVFGPYR